MPLPSKQNGIAIILLLVLLPVILGIMTLSIEGGHKLRDKARLGDAAEVAALAVSARPVDSLQENTLLVKNIVKAMVTDLKSVSVSLNTVACADNQDCDPTNSSRVFTEYQLKVSGKHQNWLGQQQPLGFDRIVTLGARAKSRKNHGEAIDVFFAADFSSSMLGHWQRVIKIHMLKDILIRTARKLEEFTRHEPLPSRKNTISLVPFSLMTFEYDAQKGVGVAVHNVNSLTPLESIPDMLVVKKPDAFFGTREFYTVPPTHSAKKLERHLKRMKPYGGTSSYEGIIRAAQLALKTKNPKRLIIVLTDGEDSDKRVHQTLIDKNYCKTLTKAIEKQRTPLGERVRANIAVISFSYDIADNKPLIDCVGKDRVFSAEDPDAIYTIISSLIAEEVGHIHASPRR